MFVGVRRLVDLLAPRFLRFSLTLATSSLAAAEPAPPPLEPLDSEYLVQTWQTEQGLPDNFINAIAQTPDGYIWVATFNGLARFNGAEFVVFDAANTPELPSNRITSLHLDHKARLWIGSESGTLSCWSEGRFQRVTDSDGLSKQGGLLREDTSGELWSSPNWDITNYFHFVDGRFEKVHTPETFFHRLGNHCDVHGRGWGIESNFLFCFDATAPARVEIPHFKIGGGWRHAGAGDGEAWRVSTNRGLSRFKLQAATTSELGRSLFEDAEGNIWFGTGGSGLYRLIPRAFRTYDARNGLASDVVRSVTEDGAGNIWLATATIQVEVPIPTAYSGSLYFEGRVQ